MCSASSKPWPLWTSVKLPGDGTNRGDVKIANEIAKRQAKLTDFDHAVHAAWLLGGVDQSLVVRRGVLRGKFTMGDQDVTPSMARLEAAGITPPHNAHIAPAMKALIARKLLAAMKRKAKP